jgi:ribonucleotide reductase alpha subunit
MNMDPEMYVLKRDGSKEPVRFDKVLERIRKAAIGLSVNYTRLAQLVLAEIHDGVRTTELDELAARLAISFMTTHPDWATLAANIIVSNCQRSAPTKFSDAVDLLAALTDKTGRPTPALADDVIAFIRTHKDALDAMVRPSNDFLLDYFGFKTLEKGYLMRSANGAVAETPQYMWLRVAIGIHSSFPSPLAQIQETYELMSSKAFTHATPTLFNSGTPRPQLSSCFLQMLKSDSVEGIFDTLKDCAQISKYAGGIGLHIHNVRAEGSRIAGTNGMSDGIVPMLRVFNNTARYINQGGRRNGSFAIYLEPWHADTPAFLKMKSNTGSEEEKARDLFYALWVPDLFMRRVKAKQSWSLFCPHEAPGLSDVVGDEFDALYTRYEAEGRAKKTIPAQKLWTEILVSQMETGTPYILYKDAANKKSNQKNLGVIKSSNLCVAPETLVTVFDPLGTRYNAPIRSLTGRPVTIWNGTDYSEITVKQTGTAQPLIRITIEQTMHSPYGPKRTEFPQLDCTPYHKFLVPSNDHLSNSRRVDASTLTPGQKLRTWIDADGVIVQQTVHAIEDTGRVDDTYCFTEPLNHTGIFNGILTGNCTEIIEYSSPEETAVCNLASIALPYFLTSTGVNFDRLRDVTAIIVRNLNRVIDINFYPTPETKRSNMRHRPIGLGVQGLADVFAVLGMAWETPEAAALNQEIFEHIYYAALNASADLALIEGPYETFAGSPASEGILQPDLWNLPLQSYKTAATLDWSALRSKIQATGLRNSLLLAPMPTASTSQIFGYTECIEPVTTNIYVRRTLAGEFTVINRYLVADLMALGQWSPELKDRIVAANGSVQGLAEIPEAIKARYKTVWETKQKTLIDMAADRGAFICQSQSLNLFVAEPTIAKLTSMHFYAWERGLKTGIYYLRTKSAVQAIKFTVEANATASAPAPAPAPEECLLCSA